MNLTELWTAIVTRLNADATLVAAIQGVYNTATPPGLVAFSASGKPYIVFSIASSTHDDAFRTDIVEHTFRFSIISSARAGLTVPSTIINRLYGDATNQSTRVPSFGLHRHLLELPDAAGSWEGGYFQHVDSSQDHTVDVYHFIETFKILTSRQSP
jgi:hypothetical protein